MAFVPGEKHFGQWTYEHWFDHEYEDVEGEDNSLDKENSSGQNMPLSDAEKTKVEKIIDNENKL